jgi:hypothetical protein
MGIEDGFAHTLILAGAFLVAALVMHRKTDDGALVGLILGLVMMAVGAADRIADHV